MERKAGEWGVGDRERKGKDDTRRGKVKVKSDLEVEPKQNPSLPYGTPSIIAKAAGAACRFTRSKVFCIGVRL